VFDKTWHWVGVINGAMSWFADVVAEDFCIVNIVDCIVGEVGNYVGKLDDIGTENKGEGTWLVKVI
jgi:hypothetical protein